MTEDPNLSKTQVETFELLARKVSRGYPLQYAIKSWEFYGLEFSLEEGVFIPRPETELLIELTLPRLKASCVGFEIGLGSGCISITLLKLSKGLIMWGCDKNPKALILARKNALKHGVFHRFFAYHGDKFSQVYGMKFDFIVSNPPYIPESFWDMLPFSVQLEGYDSTIAGPTGLEFYQSVIPNLDFYLKPGGFCVFEIAHDQGDAVYSLFEKSGFEAQVFKDLSGKDRVILGWK
ncbi:MAG: HemK/PrmC family methyltransferase [Aquificaceae bacterium]|nr:HemK/PrmC family methyltransferase [Aquificaceae bacterium]